jgi:hypothetical protein
MFSYFQLNFISVFLITSALLSADEWRPGNRFDNSIFPSLAIATAAIDKTKLGKTPANDIGDGLGQIGVLIRANQDNEAFSVEISSSNFIHKTTLGGVLPQAGVVYHIYPQIDYDYDALYRVAEPIPETISFQVTANGQDLGTKQQTVEVRSLGDCPFAIKQKEGAIYPMEWMFAAYVDENSPIVDRVLQRALQLKLVPSFTAYQGDAQSVYHQMFAVWDVLQRQGIKYSDITTPSVGSSAILSQHIRSITASISDAQANCVDGSVLFASIYRKIGLNTFLVLVPHHCYVGVCLDPQGKQFVILETTRIGTVDQSHPQGLFALLPSRENVVSVASFKSACAIGLKEFQAAIPHIKAREPWYYLINMDEARRLGIQPLRSQ